MIYDAAIIGTGPAGISAALNLKIHEKNFIWLGSRQLSEKISKAERISNYPGFFSVTGKELTDAFTQQISQMQIEITESMVNSVLPFDGHYALMAGENFYEAQTVILATGTAFTAALQQETDWLGKGVSYCATCDGGLYRDKTIAVICGNARFEHEARYLAELAKTVYFFPEYPNASDLSENTIKPSQKPAAVEGEQRVTGLRLKDGTLLPVDGVFCLRDSVTLSALLPNLQMQENHIAVDRRMATNLAGCFAAGDCTGRPYQYTKSVGEGNVAAHSAIEYLASL